MSHFKLRPYQQECIDSIPESGSYLIQMATGLGKTVTFSKIPRRGRMLILSHREELVKQPIKYFDCPVGIEQGKDRSNGEEIVSASVQSLRNRLDKFNPDDFDIIITDEAHHAAAKSYRKIYDYFNPRLHLGFTATPNRGDKFSLEDIYSDIIYEYPLVKGIEDGYLSNIECRRAYVGIDFNSIATRLGDFAKEDLAKKMSEDYLVKAVADAYYKFAKGSTLIFAVNKDHARLISEAIEGSRYLTSDDKPDVRNKTVEAFKNGEFDCLVNCMLFTEGTDMPNIETVIIARPTKSEALYQQMVGRGTRLYPNKEKLHLVDIVGATQCNDLCTASTLIGLDENIIGTEDQKLLDGLDLFDIPEMVEKLSDTPDNWIRNSEVVDLFEEQGKFITHGINFFRKSDGSLLNSTPSHNHIISAPNLIGEVWFNGDKYPNIQRAIDTLYKHLHDFHSSEEAIWNNDIRGRWIDEPASEKQMNFVNVLLRRNHYVLYKKDLTKGEASQIIERLKR